MRIKHLNIIVSIIAAILLLWLAFRTIDFGELWDQISTVTLYWLPFFLVVMIFSHLLRAERWRQLLPDDCKHISRSTLFAGVMLGYMVNNLVPRLGEVSRPVYVAKKEKVSTGNLMGTIVAERLFDVLVLFLLIFITMVLILGDLDIVQQLFGIENWSGLYYLILPASLLLIVASVWVFYRVMLWLDEKEHFSNPVIIKILSSAKSFGEGMVSLNKVKNWPMFLLLTTGIWIGYILMTYLPFYMMNMQDQFALGLGEAIVITVVSSVGVSIPTPAAIGSYHLLVQQALWLLYDVPLTTALTYATVVHAFTMLLVFIVSPAALWWDKYHTLTRNDNR
ncbi:MAG: flippase-like domain-containing protein [Balneolaceae bacterium]|nr:flippase-like domain-containing protein [Balneolaceae bacterium]